MGRSRKNKSKHRTATRNSPTSDTSLSETGTNLGALAANSGTHEHDVHIGPTRIQNPRPKRGLRAYFSNLSRASFDWLLALLGRPRNPKSGGKFWCTTVRLVIRGGNERRVYVAASFDSQCPVNLISKKTVREHGLENHVIACDPSPYVHTLTGEPLYRSGTINTQIRCDLSFEILGGLFAFNPRKHHDVTFAVVDSNAFEIIIGHPTLEELRIYQDKEMMMPFRTDVGSTGDTAAQQQAADEARARERLREQAAEQRRRDAQQRVRMQVCLCGIPADQNDNQGQAQA